MSVHWVACDTCYTKTEGTELGGIELQRSSNFCVGFPHTLSAPAMWLALFVYESQVLVTWSLLGRERTLGMTVSVCVWRPLLLSAVVIRCD